MPKIIHYRGKCIGCNICYEMQADVWRMSKKDGKARLLRAEIKKDIYMLEINEDQLELSNRTAKACPVKIIKVL
jgi:ferredoxin